MSLPSLPHKLKRRRDLYLPILLTVIDLTAIIAGLMLAYWLRFGSLIIPVAPGSYSPNDYLRLLPISGGGVARQFLFHTPLPQKTKKSGAGRPSGAWSKAPFWQSESSSRPSSSSATSPRTENPLARWIIPLALITVPTCFCVGRYLLHRTLILMARRSGRGLAHALIIGAGPSAKEMARALRHHPEYGWTVVGYLSDKSEDVGRQMTGIEVKATITELPRILEQEEIEAVFVAQPDFRHEMLAYVFVECQKRLVEVKVVPDCTEMLFSSVSIEEVDGIPFLGLRETPLQGWGVVMKRFFDVIFAGSILVISLPIMIILAWLVRRSSPGPIFYQQERIGADSEPFDILKFRTMYIDAENRTGPVFSTANDPRQTPIGRFLRQVHLDELPQLLNVLWGEMSVVGPRPERPFFVEQFSEEIPRYMARHRIKSGITGWAQVNGQTGHEGTIADRLRYDLYYIENWSIFFDLKILLLTIIWVFRRLRQLATLPGDHPSLRRAEADSPDQIK